MLNEMGNNIERTDLQAGGVPAGSGNDCLEAACMALAEMGALEKADGMWRVKDRQAFADLAFMICFRATEAAWAEAFVRQAGITSGDLRENAMDTVKLFRDSAIASRELDETNPGEVPPIFKRAVGSRECLNEMGGNQNLLMEFMKAMPSFGVPTTVGELSPGVMDACLSTYRAENGARTYKYDLDNGIQTGITLSRLGGGPFVSGGVLRDDVRRAFKNILTYEGREITFRKDYPIDEESLDAADRLRKLGKARSAGFMGLAGLLAFGGRLFGLAFGLFSLVPFVLFIANIVLAEHKIRAFFYLAVLSIAAWLPASIPVAIVSRSKNVTDDASDLVSKVAICIVRIVLLAGVIRMQLVGSPL